MSFLKLMSIGEVTRAIMAMFGFTPRVPSNLRFQESRFSQRFGKATFKFNTTLRREAVLKKSGKNKAETQRKSE
jgi:hypothetical protein